MAVLTREASGRRCSRPCGRSRWWRVSGGHKSLVEEIEGRTFSTCRWEDAAAVGFALLRRGEVAAARRSLDRTLARMTERKQIAAISGCSFVLGLLAMEEDELRDAEVLLGRSLEIARRGGSVLFELWVLPVLCELFIRSGNLDRAAQCVERGLGLLDPTLNWYGVAAGVSLARGMLARECRQWEEADQAFRQAAALNGRYELVWDEAKTLSEWARMHERRDRAGDREETRAKLTTARTLFQRAGAARDVAKTDAAISRGA